MTIQYNNNIVQEYDNIAVVNDYYIMSEYYYYFIFIHT